MGEMVAWFASEVRSDFERAIVKYECEKAGAIFEECPQ